MTSFLFYSGLGMTAYITFATLTPGEIKRGAAALPFMLFAAAAVSHYIGN